MARKYELTIGAGEQLDVAAAGEFLTVLKSTLTTVLVGFDGAADLEMQPGLSFRPGRPFRVVTIRNPNLVAVTLSVVIGAGALDDRRQVSSSADSFEPLTLADARAIAFRTTTTLSPTAGQYMHLQLWNPASSGVLMVVRQLIFWTDTAGRITAKFHNAALANLSSNVRSVYAGDPDGEVELRNESSASLVGSGAAVLQVEAVANTSVIVDFPSPVILPEGQGLVAQRTTVTATLGMSADVLEIPG